jgi:hypothetical protein
MPYTASPFRFRTTVRVILSLVLLGVLLLYVVWQARFLLTGPVIVLRDEPPQHSNERIVTLSGAARNITSITLNGRQIFTDPHGEFKEALVLENGYTIATIAATDRYGRTTELRRPFIYTPASILTE